LASGSARPNASERSELEAFHELELLVHHLGEELAGFRKRALTAESRLKQFDLTLTSKTPTPERLAALERLNKDLKARLEAATERTRLMVERVKFLREQQQASAGVR
jgi:hypothetical protein